MFSKSLNNDLFVIFCSVLFKQKGMLNNSIINKKNLLLVFIFCVTIDRFSFWALNNKTKIVKSFMLCGFILLIQFFCLFYPVLVLCRGGWCPSPIVSG